MALYVQIDEDGEPISFPILPNNIRDIMGTWDFTEDELRARGFATLINGDPPHITDGQDCAAGEIIKNEDGSPEQLWVITDISLEEKLDRWVRRRRVNMLVQSDWTQSPDSPLSSEEKAAWATYRQALRDMTTSQDFEQITSSTEIVWPNPPGTEIPPE